MLATSRRALLPFVLLAACYDKPASDTGGDVTGDSTNGTSGPSTSATMTTTTVGESSSSPTTTATTSVDESTNGSTGTSPGSSDDASESTGGPVATTICDQQPTTLSACVGMSKDQLNQGTLACDPAVMFTAFFEDVWTIDVAAGACIYVNVDNISDAGPVGGMQADVALQLRSPSGAYAFADDEAICQDVTWTGGQCPEATLTADVAGTWEISVVQASGGGCVAAAPYILYVAIDGVATIATFVTDDERTDC